MNSRRTFILAVAAAMANGSAFSDTLAPRESVNVEVEMLGEVIVVTASVSVPAAPEQAWTVLTDYDHMTDFLPNLDFSKRLEGTQERFPVWQKGTILLGPF